ncbi:polysaccharide biosynthesis protein [Roseospirillum parvum]|uniref:O-antigen biosynthesis protein WbqV n=1 Tax=Roseospirillum parvum TaxID=83401 RepID=A0A1G7W314_9PROT|nr:nucleoside-diphosphate sugar epimerase/dehydratase [Roseospirillum parvum]SDG66366.1 O-antigen biosynthesis protein WbqV [Roseospirillum parvum]
MKKPRLAPFALLPGNRRARVAYVHDITMAGLSFAAALFLRVGEAMPFYPPEVLYGGPLLMALIGVVVFRAMRLYRGVWRYASTHDLVAITRAATAVVLVFLLAMFLWSRLEAVPRSVPFINWFVLMALLGGPRFAYRMIKDGHLGILAGGLAEDGPGGGPAGGARGGPRGESVRRIPVLLVGAGGGAELFIRDASRAGSANLYRPVGLLTRRPERLGRSIRGIGVLGTLDDLAAVVARLEAEGRRPERLILTSDDFDGATVRRLLDAATGLNLSLARLPRLTDFRDHAAAEGRPIEVRPVALEDLLGRPQAVLDRAAMGRLVAGRRVLVTGAGGSIGGELVRQIAALGPARLTLVDHGEYALYEIDMEMATRAPDLQRVARLADVRDRAAVDRLFAAEQPELVFHAAALKHVPMVEANPLEGLLTNAIGSRVVADACRAHGVALLVQISTDKAVNPTNVMGAAKRLAEMYGQALDAQSGADTCRVVTVRFGNVLGSTGSVIPLFTRQLAAGGPLTVTHPEVTRYFMTIREAVELVLEASALGLESPAYEGRIFVLDMGQPVRIADLARQMIRLAGLVPERDIAIEYIGLRPGEKLYEEIFHGAEPPQPTDHKGLLVASPRVVARHWLGGRLDALEAACRAGDHAAALAVVAELVPEYAPAAS